jgi:hypothetical protein
MTSGYNWRLASWLVYLTKKLYYLAICLLYDFLKLCPLIFVTL